MFDLADAREHLADKVSPLSELRFEEALDEIERLRDVTRELRLRIHNIEKHNQFFERCESHWCNPVAPLAAGGGDIPWPKGGDHFAHKRVAELEAEVAKWKHFAMAQTKSLDLALEGRYIDGD